MEANFKLLKTLYKIYSPTGREKQMREFIMWWVKTNCPTATIAKDRMGNIYVTKGDSDTYPCVVSHLDQVQKFHSSDFEVIEDKDVFLGISKKHHRQEGLGADDKNGIWICLTCLEKYDVLKCAFFVEEEVGCFGSDKADMTFFDNCRFVLQCDRKGRRDLITNIGGWTPLCSESFLQCIGFEKFGYKEEVGMLTDVATLKENGLKVCALNMSCGYYNPHTDYEFTIKNDLLNCLALTQHIIETCQDVCVHEFVSDWGRNYGSREKEEEYEDFIDIISYTLSYRPETTVDEFMKEYQDMYIFLTKEDFEHIFKEVKEPHRIG